MSLSKSKTTTTLFLSCLLFYIFISLGERTTTYYYSGYGSSLFQLAVAFLVAALIIVAVRTTMVTWITVLVLLAFAGKRRRVLVKDGRKITSDVAMYLVKVAVKERGLAAIACATIVSLGAVEWLRKSW